MNDILLFAISISFFTSLILSLFFFILYSDYKINFFYWGGVAFAAYSIRFVFQLINKIYLDTLPFLQEVTLITALVSAVLLFYAVSEYLNNRNIKIVIYFTALLILWVIAEYFLDLGFKVVAIPVFVFQAMIYIYSGILFLRNKEVSNIGSKVVGWTFILWGIHKTDYPILAPIQELAVYGYFLNSIFALTVGSSLFLSYYKKTRQQVFEINTTFQNILENSYDLIYRIQYQPIKKFIYMSPSCEKILGFTDQEFYDDPDLHSKIIHPEDLELFNSMVFGEEKNTPTFRCRAIHKYGNIIYLEQKLNSFFSNGKLIYLEATGRDVTDNILIENELRILSSTVEQLPISALVTDIDFFIQYVNSNFESTFGFLLHEIRGKSFNELKIFSTEFKDTKIPWEEIENKGFVKFEETKLDTNQRFEITLSPIINEDPNIVHYVFIIEDISDRIFRINSLKESEEKYKSIFENKHLVMLIIDPADGKIIDANSGAVNYYGYSSEELKSNNIFGLSTLSKVDMQKRMLDALKNPLIKFTSLHKLSTGEIRNVEVASGPIVINSKQYLLSVITDITEKILIEEELNSYRTELERKVVARTRELEISEKNFVTLAENSNDSIARFDENLKLLYMNSEFKKRFGIGDDNYIGKELSDFDSLKDLCDIFNDHLSASIRNKKTSDVEINIYDDVWVDYSFIPEFNYSDKIDSMLLFGHDISGYKKLEEKIKSALSSEKELSELKSRFISTLSHELRTPLAAIMSSAELLERYSEKWEKEKKNEHYVRIKSSVDFLTEMMNDMLTINHVESGKLIFNPAKVNLVQTVRDLIDEVLFIDQNKHIIVFDNKLDDSEFIMDAKLIRLILQNIISNSVKYSESGKKVIVSLKQTKKDLKIRLCDEGIGIPGKDIQYLFEPFHRADNAEEYKGTGLGLSIVKKSVELHNGAISVWSRLKRGTLVMVTFPIAEVKNR